MNALVGRGGLFDDFFKEMNPGFYVRPLHGDPLPTPGQMKVDVKHLFDEDGSSLHHHGGGEGHADENDRGDKDLYRPGLIV